MKRSEEKLSSFFTDFNGTFNGRLASVRPKFALSSETSRISSTARYQCSIKTEYQKDLMRLIEEGMILAIRNFRSYPSDQSRFTLVEITGIRPEHFGLRGISDQSYYPMQFEIIEQSVKDWESDDRSTMMVAIEAIPINYDLDVNENGDPFYIKGFSYPIIGERAHILNHDLIHQMYNRRTLQDMGRNWREIETSEIARRDPRLGSIKMFESAKEKIPIYVDFEKLIRYHFGIFSFTGGGKSNLLSNILRRLVYHSPDTKIVIFDISMEYPFLLMDVFADTSVPSMILLDEIVSDGQMLSESVVKPRRFEDDERVPLGLQEIIDQGKVKRFVRPRHKEPAFQEILDDISAQLRENAGKRTYSEALELIRSEVQDYMDSKGKHESDRIDKDFVEFLTGVASDAVEKFRVSDKSNVYGWATSRRMLLDRIKRAENDTRIQGQTLESTLRALGDSTRILCFSIADPLTIKELVRDATSRVLWNRKRRFTVDPTILFVLDEAQEFVPRQDDARGIEKESSQAVETLLRQGRKYGLGACIATQRIAYLNTNALQQLHTYFVGTLPRPYDRTVVSDTFTIDLGILEKTLEFPPGHWLLSSYIATGMENVPIFIRSDDTENEIETFLRAVT